MIIFGIKFGRLNIIWFKISLNLINILFIPLSYNYGSVAYLGGRVLLVI